MAKSTLTEAIVIKRLTYKEADRIITFYSRELGKFTALAKGVRKLHSRKKSALEMGTFGKYLIIHAKSFDIVTQSTIINSFPSLRTELPRITQFNQILEIIDLLTRESQTSPELFELLHDTLAILNKPGKHKQQIVRNVHQMLVLTGFSTSEDMTEVRLKQEIEAIAERKLRTKTFLTPNSLNP